MSLSTKHQSWADVAVFEQLDAGLTLKKFLAEKGLESRTYDDHWFRRFLFLRPPRITYRVQVRQGEMRNANEFLKSAPPAFVNRAIHCPFCESLRVAYPQMTRKFILPTILLHLGIIFRVIDHECYCENCHYTWNLAEHTSELVPKHAK